MFDFSFAALARPFIRRKSPPSGGSKRARWSTATDQSGVSTALHAVDDCLLSLRLSQPLHGELAIEMHLHERVIRVVLESAGEPWSLAYRAPLTTPSRLATQTKPWQLGRIVGQMQIDVGRCDGRLLLESDLQRA
ncbi:MAG: hypothetical protein R3C56_24840 [Pirellulaceae bacterium]